MAAVTRKTNWFAIWISAGVVVALVVVAGLVIWMNAMAGGPGQAPESAQINAETGAISVGDGPETFDTYLDFMCPICNSFEQAYGPEIQKLVADGTITLNLHPIAILDRASQGTQFSTRAANAMYCVADAKPDAAVAFMQAMFAGQPAEGSTGLTNDQIITIAESVGVKDASSCITEGTFSKFVTAMTKNTPVAPGAAGVGTPTLAVNGTVIKNSDLPQPADLASLFK